jgi:serine protease Do
MRLASLTALIVLAVAAGAPADEPTKKDLLLAIEEKLKAANETAGPSVGCVVVSRSELYGKPPSDLPGKLGGFDPKAYLKANPKAERVALSLDLSDPKNIPDHGFACGVVIDASGLVLTPYHVVEGATKVYVHLPAGGSYADVHAADARSDFAVLKLLTPPEGLKPIKFGTVRTETRGDDRATLFPGKLVILMANPYAAGGRVGPSASLGGVTEVQRRFAVDPKDLARASDSYYHYGTVFAHDAKLSAGISGAALLNLDGELIGLATTHAAVSGGDRAPQYAIPADENFRRVMDVLKRGEEVEYGFLGVRLPGPGVRTDNGLTINVVTPYGPAALSGLQNGDTVTHINGVQIRSSEDLQLQIGSTLAGQKTKVTVRRGGRVFDLDVTLGKFRHDQPHIASVRPEAAFGLRVDYSSILAQQLDTNTQVLTRGLPAGVCVRELVPSSQAEMAFKKLGDNPTRWMITHVNGTPVTTPAEYYKAVKGQTSLKLTVKDPTDRNDREHEVTIP